MSESRVDIARHKIKALNSTNYSIWSKKMQLLLRGKALWSIVCGDEKEPSAELEKDEHKKFVQRRDVALTDILLSIEDSCSQAVINLEDPKSVWDKLKEMYKGVSDAYIDTYLVKLQNLKMGPTENIMGYVNRLMEVENDLASVGHSLDEKEKKRSLLRGLREDFATTAKVIRAMDTDFTKAVSELVIEEGSLQVELNDVNTSDKALNTVERGHYSCTHCGRSGHTADRCFHNPASKNYKKDIKYDFRKGNNKDRKKMKKKYSKKLDSGDDLGDVAMMAKSVIRGDVKPAPSLKNKWMVDSASTSHICNNAEKFIKLKKQPRHTVEVGEGQLVEVSGVGTVRVAASVDGRKQVVTLKSVLFVPTMMCNLLSVSKARRAGFRTVFDGDEDNNGYCEMIHKESGKVYIKAIERPEGLYEAQFTQSGASTALVSIERKQELWHKRLAHASPGVMAKTLPIVTGMDLPQVKVTSDSKCEDCEIGKSCHQRRPMADKESREATEILELVHTDIVGPIKHPSLTGKRYFIPLYEDRSAVSLVRFIRSKGEAGAAIKEMVTQLETARKTRVKKLSITMYVDEVVKRLRSDNAKEFLSRSFTNWLSEKGIVHELSSAYSPESNGKAERLNRSLLDMSRTMLIGAQHLPKHNLMWAEAVNAACYIRNRLFSTASTVPGKTPYEIMMNKKPNVSYLRIFGSKAYVHVPKAKRKSKFTPRARIGYLVGFERGNSFRVYIPDEGKVVVSRDVSFDENFTQKKNGTDEDNEEDVDDAIKFDDPFQPFRDDAVSSVIHSADVTGSGNYDQAIENTDETRHPLSDDDEPHDPTESVTHYPNLRRSTRQTKHAERLGYDTAMFVHEARMHNEEATTPLTYHEAVSGPDNALWMDAMDKEMQQIDDKGTWKLVKPPEDARVVKNKWVYTCKKDAKGELKRRRARLVAKGFTQEKGVDYDEVFAPVAKYTTVRTMLALAAHEDQQMLLLDVKGAFLNGELDETIFMNSQRDTSSRERKTSFINF